MKKKRIEVLNHFNYKSKQGSSYENCTGSSMTVPGESYTIQELIKKHTSGIPVNVEIRGEYDEDPTHEDFDKREVQNMDLVDKEEILQQNLDKISNKKIEIQQKREEKAKADTQSNKAKATDDQKKQESQKTSEKTEGVWCEYSCH